MTQEEKAKAYDEALKKASAAHKDEDRHLKATLERIFPELKEDDDEKIKKDLIQWVDEFPDTIWRGHYKNDIIAWLEEQGDKDKLIQELGEYKVKYTQEVLEKHITSMSNKDDERLRKNTISFLKEFADLGYENAVECIDWLEKQGEDKKEINNFDVLPGLYKCIHRMFDGTPDGRLLFEIDNVYKCLSKHDRAEFEVSYGHSVYLEDPIVRKYFIPFEGEQISSPKFKVGDKIVNSFRKYMRDLSSQGIISKITNDKYIFTDGSYISISNQDSWELVHDKKSKFDPKTFQPYDKVLIRRGNENFYVWFPDFVSNPPNNDNNKTLCMCVGDDIAMVIPYNDDTKYLVGTTNEAPEYYRYWED